MKRISIGIKKSICVAVIISTSINGISQTIAQTNQIYYQSDQISAIDTANQNSSFITIGQQHLIQFSSQKGTLPNGLLPQIADLLSDGKSNVFTVTLPYKTNNFFTDSSQITVDYSAYGGHNQFSHKSSGLIFGYNGEYQDHITHLTDFRARNYNSNYQRFMTMDSYPVWNKYSYSDADPVNHIDPTGHNAKQWLEQNAAWLVPTTLAVIAIGAGVVYKYKNQSSFYALSKKWKALPSEVSLTKADIMTQGQELGSGTFGTAYLMNHGKYRGLVFKIVHDHMLEDKLSDPARNVRYLNQANWKYDFAKVVKLESGETIQMSRYVEGEKYRDEIYETFFHGARQQFRANDVDVKDILAPGNVILDRTGRYWLVDADNAMSNYRDRSNSAGSQLLWKMAAAQSIKPTNDGWLE